MINSRNKRNLRPIALPIRNSVTYTNVLYTSIGCNDYWTSLNRLSRNKSTANKAVCSGYSKLTYY